MPFNILDNWPLFLFVRIPSTDLEGRRHLFIRQFCCFWELAFRLEHKVVRNILNLRSLLHANKCLAGMFIGARAVIGFGIAFNFTAAPLLMMELGFPTQKVISTSSPVQIEFLTPQIVSTRRFLQCAMELWCYRCCLDDIWNFPYYKHLGLANPLHSSGSLQHFANCSLLRYCGVPQMAYLTGP